MKENYILSTSAEIPLGRRAFIIAEAGINHNGDLNLAHKMIDIAKNAGVDAIKFQTFRASEFCGEKPQDFSYFSQGRKITEPMLEMFTRMELGDSAWQELKDHTVRIGLDFFSTPQNVSDLELLLSVGVSRIKVGSDDLTNTPLLKAYSEFDLPIILSSGMADIGEVNSALSAAGWFNGRDVSVLVCTSEYPCSPENANVNRVSTLRGAFPGLVVGFSDHTQGNTSAILAVALGAVIFEKHFTIDHNLEGPDHWFSLNPEQLRDWVHAIREAEIALGHGKVIPTEREWDMRDLARRSVVALCEIQKGTVLDTTNIGLRRPGSGFSPASFKDILGRKAQSKLDPGHILTWNDI